MHHVYQSNHSDSLFVMMQAVIHEHGLQQNPLKPLTIIVPSQGMAQWLKQCFAQSEQIAANINCILPSEWLWNCYRDLLGEIPKHLPFDKHQLVWHLFKLFINDDAIKQVIPYPIDLSTESGLYKTYQFAETLADLYDQYLVYRQPVLKQWEDGQSDPSFPWQSELWQTLNRQHANQGYLHTGQCHSDFVSALRANKQLEQGHSILFGFASYEPNLISAIEALSINHQLHSFMLAPCQEYWMDQHKRNAIEDDVHALLASWGKLGRDFSNYLIDQSHHNPELLDSDVKAFSGSDSNTLLSQLQQGIRLLDTAAIDHQDNDFSLSLHRCYGPLREIQVLHDQILHLLNEHENIELSDICVMMTDVKRYSPYIESVFQQNSRHKIAYTLSDAIPLLDEPVIQHFFELLELPSLPMSNETLLNWLQIEAFTAAFNLNAEEVEVIKQWLKATEIRWGLDTQHQKEMNTPIGQNSWEFGINRLITGYFMSPNHQEPVIYNDQLAAPIDSYDSHAATIHCLWKLKKILKTTRDKLKKKQSIVQWHNTLKALLESCYQANEASQYSINQLHQAVDGLLTMSEQADFTETLSLEVVSHYLKQSLNQKQRLVRFLRGGVNFVSLQPLRAIPFKAIYILGLNQNDYPRKNERLSFDLLGKETQLGDRSPSEEDKYLFLEALMSAEVKLGLFWQGWNLSNNSELFPSSLVTELETFITDRAGKAALEAISFNHSLHAFDAENYQQETAKPLSQSFKALPEQRIETDAFSTEVNLIHDAQTLELSRLIAFFRDPIRQFLRRLNIDFKEATLTEVTEPFDINKYQQRDLNMAIIEQLQNEDMDHEFKQLKLSGQFPYHFDELKESAYTQLSGYAELLKSEFENPEELELSLTLPKSGLVISGAVTLYNQQLIIPCYDAIEKKDFITKAAPQLIALWLNSLLIASQTSCTSKLIGFNKKHQPLQWQLNGIEPSHAIDQLESIVALYLKSYQAPIPFDNYSSNKALSSIKDFDDINAPEAQAKAMRAQNFDSPAFYTQDLLFEHGIENHPNFLATADQFWGNFFKALN